MNKLKKICKELPIKKISKIIGLPKIIVNDLCKTLLLLNKNDMENIQFQFAYLAYLKDEGKLNSTEIVREYYKEKNFKTITNYLKNEQELKNFISKMKTI